MRYLVVSTANVMDPAAEPFRLHVVAKGDEEGECNVNATTHVAAAAVRWWWELIIRQIMHSRQPW